MAQMTERVLISVVSNRDESRVWLSECSNFVLAFLRS
jgi:hypothetical protein